jgi:hypothetical protein
LQNQEQANTQNQSQEWCHDFNVNLGFANTGTSEIFSLHTVLQKEGISYSPDGVNMYGEPTAYAVIIFQTKYGIRPRSGYVGVLTRAKFNQLYGCEGGKTISGNNTLPTGTGATGCEQGTTWNYATNICESCIAGTEPYLDGPVWKCRSVNGQSVCASNWQCTNWSSCSNNQQTRSCADSNYCNTTEDKPTVTRSCNGNSNSTCTSNWQCTNWSSCSNNQQTRSCVDGNFCGIATDKPTEVKLCNSVCTPDWNCSDWGTCKDRQQTRTCVDNNFCGTTTGKPPQSQFCLSRCGDGVCQPGYYGEDHTTCPQDCRIITCGDGWCDGGLNKENSINCPQDCQGFVACGNGICESGESTNNCAADCKSCTLNSDCGNGQECKDGICKTICTPTCLGKNCGSDGCGGVCGSCFYGQICNSSGTCATKPDLCAGVSCPSNQVCFGGTCNDNCYRVGGIMYDFCPTGTQHLSSLDYGGGKCCKCIPACNGKNCGSDGCGGGCGSNWNYAESSLSWKTDCPSWQSCINGICKDN